jgi:DNA-binding NarL/FixJ family response regulator
MVKALIVEGGAVFRHSLRQVLAARFPFMHVEETGGLHEGLQRAHDLHPDLFFIAIQLPDGSGLDLARILAAGFRQAEICMVAVFDVREYRIAARECGARHFLAQGGSTSADLIDVTEAFLAERARVLIVETDASRRQMLADTVSADWPNVIVVEAIDGVGAFRTALALKPDLVVVGEAVLDADSPGLCRMMRSIHAPSTLVVVTAEPALDARAAATHWEADQVVAMNHGVEAEIGLIVCGLVARHATARFSASDFAY